MERELRIIEDQIEEDYNLTNLGLLGLHIVNEPTENLMYLYSTEDDLYYELDKNFIDKLMNHETITIILDEGEKINLNEEQTTVIKDILNGWITK